MVESLWEFGHLSKFRRCCMTMLAWCLSNEDQTKTLAHFNSLDTNQQGSITPLELKHAMTDYLQIDDEHEISQVFDALDCNHDHTIHYSAFLAAMLGKQIGLSDSLLACAFRRFDADGSGLITMDDLRYALGDQVDGEIVGTFVQEVDQNKDGCIRFTDFVTYLRGDIADQKETLQWSPRLPAHLGNAWELITGTDLSHLTPLITGSKFFNSTMY